jgi:hypothetical protein
MEGLTTGIEVLGLKEAVKYLAQVEPGFKKAYVANMKQVAQPMTDAMKASYSESGFPSGTQRNWTSKGVKKFPLTTAGAVKGVALRVNNKKTGAAFSVMQKNPAASIFDIAGRSNANPLGSAVDTKFGRSASRVIWPVFEAKISDISANIQKVVDDVIAEVNKNFKVI